MLVALSPSDLYSHLNASSHPHAIKFFTGGMPRASYGDRYTLTAMRNGRMVVFDFGSPVVDFFLVPRLQNTKGLFPFYGIVTRSKQHSTFLMI